MEKSKVVTFKEELNVKEEITDEMEKGQIEQGREYIEPETKKIKQENDKNSTSTFSTDPPPPTSIEDDSTSGHPTEETPAKKGKYDHALDCNGTRCNFRCATHIEQPSGNTAHQYLSDVSKIFRLQEGQLPENVRRSSQLTRLKELTRIALAVFRDGKPAQKMQEFLSRMVASYPRIISAAEINMIFAL